MGYKMKFKVSRREIVKSCPRVRCAGYCDLQYLLRGVEPKAYNSGTYGWNFDMYEVYGLTICTGYRNMPGKRLEHIKEYESQAREIWSDYSLPYETQSAKVNELLKEFCELNK